MKGNKDRQIIEDYLKLYCIEEIFDETINYLIEKKSSDPFKHVSNFLLQNTMPEILQIKIFSRIVGNGIIGIQVEISSNIGSFIGNILIFILDIVIILAYYYVMIVIILI